MVQLMKQLPTDDSTIDEVSIAHVHQTKKYLLLMLQLIQQISTTDVAYDEVAMILQWLKQLSTADSTSDAKGYLLRIGEVQLSIFDYAIYKISIVDCTIDKLIIGCQKYNQLITILKIEMLLINHELKNIYKFNLLYIVFT